MRWFRSPTSIILVLSIRSLVTFQSNLFNYSITSS